MFNLVSVLRILIIAALSIAALSTYIYIQTLQKKLIAAQNKIEKIEQTLKENKETEKKIDKIIKDTKKQTNKQTNIVRQRIVSFVGEKNASDCDNNMSLLRSFVF